MKSSLRITCTMLYFFVCYIDKLPRQPQINGNSKIRVYRILYFFILKSSKKQQNLIISIRKFGGVSYTRNVEQFIGISGSGEMLN
jgi:hypothetical protein